MKKYKRYKIILPLIVLILCQSLILSDCFWCVHSIKSCLEFEQKNTLAPGLNLNKQEIAHIYRLFFQDSASLDKPSKSNVPENGDRRDFLIGLASAFTLKGFSDLFGRGASNVSAQEKMFEHPCDLVLDFGAKVDSSALKRYAKIIEKHKLLRFVTIMDDENTTKLVLSLGEPEIGMEVVSKNLNRDLKRSGLKTLEIVSSSAVWEQTKTFREIKAFINTVDIISVDLGQGKINKKELQELFQAVTYVESRFKHWEKGFMPRTYKLVSSETGASGVMQIVKASALKQVAFWVFGGADNLKKNVSGGWVRHQQVLKAVEKVKKEYLEDYLVAGRINDQQKKELAVKAIIKNTIQDSFWKEQGVYVNIYYLLALWQAEFGLDENIAREIVGLIAAQNLAVEGEAGGCMPDTYLEAKKQVSRERLRNALVYEVVGKEIINKIQRQGGTVAQKHKKMMEVLLKQTKEDKSYNQKIGGLYLFFQYDRTRRLKLTRKGNNYALKEGVLADPFEYGYDHLLSAAAAYNSGWSTVKQELLLSGPDWAQNIVGVRPENPREPINYVRKYLEFTLRHTGYLTEQRNSLRCALNTERYKRIYKTRKRQLFEYCETKKRYINGRLIKRHKQYKKNPINSFNYKIDSQLASLLSAILGTEYVDSFISSYDQWDEHILSSTEPTFNILAMKITNKNCPAYLYQNQGEALLNYLRKNGYTTSCNVLEQKINEYRSLWQQRLKIEEQAAELKRKQVEAEKANKEKQLWLYARDIGLKGFAGLSILSALFFIIRRRIKLSRNVNKDRKKQSPRIRSSSRIEKSPMYFRGKNKRRSRPNMVQKLFKRYLKQKRKQPKDKFYPEEKINLGPRIFDKQTSPFIIKKRRLNDSGQSIAQAV
ncbi:MAG: hypothetical protein DRP78_01335 [Candidatus Omnitrophota bacterium]|nr:MAG: hypothetical protein DRP78_01335 [Candidatus Omnitrophota bacterium]